MLVVPPFERFIAGIAAALIICGALRWTAPILRELLIALAVGAVLNLVVADHLPNLAAGRIPQASASHEI